MKILAVDQQVTVVSKADADDSSLAELTEELVESNIPEHYRQDTPLRASCFDGNFSGDVFKVNYTGSVFEITEIPGTDLFIDLLAF